MGANACDVGRSVNMKIVSEIRGQMLSTLEANISTYPWRLSCPATGGFGVEFDFCTLRSFKKAHLGSRFIQRVECIKKETQPTEVNGVSAVFGTCLLWGFWVSAAPSSPVPGIHQHWRQVSYIRTHFSHTSRKYPRSCCGRYLSHRFFLSRDL